MRGAKLLWGEASTSSLLALHLAKAGLILHHICCGEPRQLCWWDHPWGDPALLLPPTIAGDGQQPLAASGCGRWKEVLPGQGRRRKRRRKELGNGHSSKGCPKHDALQSFSRGLSRSFKVCVKSVTLAKTVKITWLVEEMKGSPLPIPP